LFYVTGLAFPVGSEVNAVIEHTAAERGHLEAKEEGRLNAPGIVVGAQRRAP